MNVYMYVETERQRGGREGAHRGEEGGRGPSSPPQAHDLKDLKYIYKYIYI